MKVFGLTERPSHLWWIAGGLWSPRARASGWWTRRARGAASLSSRAGWWTARQCTNLDSFVGHFKWWVDSLISQKKVQTAEQWSKSARSLDFEVSIVKVISVSLFKVSLFFLMWVISSISVSVCSLYGGSCGKFRARWGLVNIGAAATAEGKFSRRRMSKKKTWMKAVARGERGSRESEVGNKGEKSFSQLIKADCGRKLPLKSSVILILREMSTQKWSNHQTSIEVCEWVSKEIDVARL